MAACNTCGAFIHQKKKDLVRNSIGRSFKTANFMTEITSFFCGGEGEKDNIIITILSLVHYKK